MSPLFQIFATPAGSTKPIQLSNGEALHLSWGKNYSNLNVFQDQPTICSVPEKDDLELGKTFITQGRQQLIVILNANEELELWHNQTELLTGVVSGGRDDFAIAAGHAIEGSFLHIGLGCVWMLGKLKFFNIGVIVLAMGISMALLGYYWHGNELIGCIYKDFFSKKSL